MPHRVVRFPNYDTIAHSSDICGENRLVSRFPFLFLVFKKTPDNGCLWVFAYNNSDVLTVGVTELNEMFSEPSLDMFRTPQPSG